MVETRPFVQGLGRAEGAGGGVSTGDVARDRGSNERRYGQRDLTAAHIDDVSQKGSEGGPGQGSP